MQLNLFYKHKIAPKLALVFLLASVFHYSQAQPREFIEGVHYQALANPVPTQTDADRIEVREIFWYGCPECATLEPVMSDWGEGVRGDLVLHRTPAIWNDIMALHARIYYSAIAVNAEDLFTEKRSRQYTRTIIRYAPNPRSENCFLPTM